MSTLKVQIGANLSQLESALSTAQSKLRNFGQGLKQTGRTLSTRVTAPIAAFSALTVKAFAEQEKAELQLRAALQANGRQVDSLFNSYNAFAKEMQRVTVVGDEVTLSMLSQAESLGLTGDAAQRAVRNSIAMQSAFGVNAQSALRYTAALEQGNATMLTRYIPTLRDIEDESERAAEAQRVLGRAFSAAEAEAQSTSGQLQQMKNAWGDFMEVIGGVIAEAILPLVKRMKEWSEAAQNLNPRIVRMGVVVAGLAAAIGPALFILGQMVIAISALLSPIGLVIAAIGALGVAFVYLRDNWEAVKERFTDISWWRNAIIDMIQFFLEQNPFQYLIDGLNFVLEKLGRNPIGNIFDSAVESLEGLKTETKEYENQFGSLGRSIKNTFTELTGMSFENPFQTGETDEGGAFEAMKMGIGGVADAYSESVASIEKSTRKIPEVTQSASEQTTGALSVMHENISELGGLIQQSINDMATGFVEDLALMSTGSQTMRGLATNILRSLADLAVQMGKIILAGGIGIEALKKSLVSFTGIGAIAAGAALIAIGTAAKSALSSAGRGAGTGSVDSFQRSARDVRGQQGGEVEFRIHGNDLVGVLQNSSVIQRRTGKTTPLNR